MPTEIDSAIALRQLDWSETSQIAVFFSRNHGLIRGLAKGSRRVPSSFDGGIEPLSMGELGVVVRRDKDLLTLTEWSVQRHFAGFRRSVLAYTAATLCGESVYRGFAPQDPHPEIFDRLAATLAILDDIGHCVPDVDAAVASAARIVATMLQRVISAAGLMPPLPSEPHPKALYAFDPQTGQFSLAASPRASDHAGLWLVRASTILAIGEINATNGVGISTTERTEALSRVIAFLSAWFAIGIGKELQTTPLFRRLLAVDGSESKVTMPIA